MPTDLSQLAYKAEAPQSAVHAVAAIMPMGSAPMISYGVAKAAQDTLLKQALAFRVLPVTVSQASMGIAIG